jgi:parallel beta-helix repeat protein
VGKSFYVATNGNDSNPGTIDKPWKTFKKAVLSAPAGCTVYVRGGTYKEQLAMSRIGALGAWTTFMAYPGEEVTIDGEGVPLPDNWGGLIELGVEQFIRISGFRVINSAMHGIFVHESSNIKVDNTYIENTYSAGISFENSSNFVVDKNTAINCATLGQGAWTPICIGNSSFATASNNVVDGTTIEGISFIDIQGGKIFSNKVSNCGVGIYINSWDDPMSDIEAYDNVVFDSQDGICVNTERSGPVSHVRVYRNIVYNNDRRGLAAGWGGDPGYPVTLHDIEFANNISYGNAEEGFVVYAREDSDVQNIIVRNNLIYGNRGSGVKVDPIVSTPFILKNISIINNTVYGNGSADIWGSGGINICTREDCKGVYDGITVRNNIVSGNLNFSIAVWPWGTAPAGLVIDHNLVEGYLDNQGGFGETYGKDPVVGASSFVDAGNANFRLLKDSAAIDKGSNDGAPSADFDGTARPQGIGIDIGAFEYVPR